MSAVDDALRVRVLEAVGDVGEGPRDVRSRSASSSRLAPNGVGASGAAARILATICARVSPSTYSMA